MESLGEQQRYVSEVYPGLAELLDDKFDGGLAEVGSLGLEIGARRIVERNGYLRFGANELPQRFVRDGIGDGLANRLFDALHGRHGRLARDDTRLLRHLDRDISIPICNILCACSRHASSIGV